MVADDLHHASYGRWRLFCSACCSHSVDLDAGGDCVSRLRHLPYGACDGLLWGLKGASDWTYQVKSASKSSSKELGWLKNEFALL